MKTVNKVHAQESLRCSRKLTLLGCKRLVRLRVAAGGRGGNFPSVFDICMPSVICKTPETLQVGLHETELKNFSLTRENKVGMAVLGALHGCQSFCLLVRLWACADAPYLSPSLGCSSPICSSLSSFPTRSVSLSLSLSLWGWEGGSMWFRREEGFFFFFF
ncbi:hypothetical protein O6H91_02G022900 [Diphasiastrum complanatum]|uniref:Uncharacterized protein n=1 Tax=Diphasiastrum complanatum TaxID=34168 RepID=A0ACC2EDH9_DIPCM|nr:hypothetical protein O6H91_02G022900 [Diphasiastrum complanatum]